VLFVVNHVLLLYKFNEIAKLDAIFSILVNFSNFYGIYMKIRYDFFAAFVYICSFFIAVREKKVFINRRFPPYMMIPACMLFCGNFNIIYRYYAI